ncbi:hypothetical protein [Bdellovibrio sp. HCB2-146]|uniref:hypothetical protein n=1 Tax=Bdellovibrio sp. HCB2-146 TaxID=3394362 RepID=UPI0039BC3F76
MSFSVNAESVLDQVLNNTQDEQIALREEKIKGLTGVSLKDIATRTQLEHEIKVLKQEKGRRVLQQAIENTDMNQVSSERTAERNRFAPRRTDSGSPLLNSVIDETVAESNPAVRGREIPKERPLVLYRDADPEDIFMAKEIGGAKEKIAVYKSTDLRGRTVYKTVGDRRVVNVIVYEKVFPQEQVIYKDVSGNLKKGYPNAIYSDGTLEIKEQAGTTTRRTPGTYHLSDEVGKINNNQIETHYGKKASPYEDFSQRKDLTENEKRALEKLKRALCNL